MTFGHTPKLAVDLAAGSAARYASDRAGRATVVTPDNERAQQRSIPAKRRY